MKGSIENIEVKTENQKHKELLYLIGQENCALQEKNVSKNAIIKILDENQPTINQVSKEVKNATNHKFHKLK